MARALRLAALWTLAALAGCAVSGPAIRLESPRPGARIRSPLTIRGEARGPWYFEGSFPLVLKGRDGAVVARGVARAQGGWMTTDFVPFAGRLEFGLPPGEAGELVLQKDNPSGRPELDDSLVVPVRFR